MLSFMALRTSTELKLINLTPALGSHCLCLYNMHGKDFFSRKARQLQRRQRNVHQASIATTNTWHVTSADNVSPRQLHSASDVSQGQPRRGFHKTYPRAVFWDDHFRWQCRFPWSRVHCVTQLKKLLTSNIIVSLAVGEFEHLTTQEWAHCKSAEQPECGVFECTS